MRKINKINLNKEIYYFPLLRSIQIDEEYFVLLEELIKNSFKDEGILLKYKLLIEITVLLATGKFKLAQERAVKKKKKGLTVSELCEGLIASSSGWRLLH